MFDNKHLETLEKLFRIKNLHPTISNGRYATMRDPKYGTATLTSYNPQLVTETETVIKSFLNTVNTIVKVPFMGKEMDVHYGYELTTRNEEGEYGASVLGNQLDRILKMAGVAPEFRIVKYVEGKPYLKINPVVRSVELPTFDDNIYGNFVNSLMQTGQKELSLIDPSGFLTEHNRIELHDIENVFLAANTLVEKYLLDIHTNELEAIAQEPKKDPMWEKSEDEIYDTLVTTFKKLEIPAFYDLAAEDRAKRATKHEHEKSTVEFFKKCTYSNYYEPAEYEIKRWAWEVDVTLPNGFNFEDKRNARHTKQFLRLVNLTIDWVTNYFTPIEDLQIGFLFEDGSFEDSPIIKNILSNVIDAKAVSASDLELVIDLYDSKEYVIGMKPPVAVPVENEGEFRLEDIATPISGVESEEEDTPYLTTSLGFGSEFI
jgi:hypothetical protein